MAIQSNIALTKNEVQVYKKFKSLSVNEDPKLQGDGVIRISPFDDYFLFTLFNEINSENVPIDLTNVGTLYMVFIGQNDEIRIPNYTNVQDIDMSSGQVLFRISKENSKKILALDNRNFYISTIMSDDDGASDESVVYTGTFLSFEDGAKQSTTDQIEELRIQYSKELAELQSKIEALNTTVSDLTETNEEQLVTIEALNNSNVNLTNEVATLSEALGDSQAETLLAEAQAAQRAAELAQLQMQQQNALASSGNSGFNYIAASRNLQNYTLDVNPVTSGTSGVSSIITTASNPPGPIDVAGRKQGVSGLSGVGGVTIQ